MILIKIVLIVIGLYSLAYAVFLPEEEKQFETFKKHFDLEIRGFKDTMKGKKSDHALYFLFAMILIMIDSTKNLLRDFLLFLVQRYPRFFLILFSVMFISLAIFLHIQF